MMSVAAIVVTFRSRLLIDRCLQSLQEAGVDEIWVVDNASDDGTADYVCSNYPEVKLIHNEDNIGFAAANNCALRQTSAAKVLLLNPDAWLAPDALERMIQALEQDERIGMVGPSIERQGVIEPSLLLKPDFLASWQFILSGMRAFSTGGFSGKVESHFPWSSITDGDHIRGSCMLVRQKAIADVGLLDEAFFLYFEETEWCLRFRKRRWRVAIAPDATVYHIGKASVKTQESMPSLEFMRSAIFFWQKRYPWPAEICLRFTLFLMAASKWLLLLPFASAKSRRCWLQSVAGLALNPFRLSIIYDRARRPSSWPK